MPGARCGTYWEIGIDSQGRPIREDVRQAANTIWKAVCNRTRAVLGDDVESADILERCMGRVSRYLDAHGATLFKENVNALLFVSFRRELWSVRRRRRIPVDIREYADHLGDSTWSETVDSQLDFESLIRHLSDRSRVVLNLRRAGYSWKEVAALLCTTVPEVKSSFWRDVFGLKAKLASSRLQDHGCLPTANAHANCKSFPNNQGRPLLNAA